MNWLMRRPYWGLRETHIVSWWYDWHCDWSSIARFGPKLQLLSNIYIDMGTSSRSIHDCESTPYHLKDWKCMPLCHFNFGFCLYRLTKCCKMGHSFGESLCIDITLIDGIPLFMAWNRGVRTLQSQILQLPLRHLFMLYERLMLAVILQT